MRSEPQPRLVRGIGRWSLVALVLNSIIGSGVFGLPSLVAGLVGGAAPLAYLAAAAGMGAPSLLISSHSSHTLNK